MEDALSVLTERIGKLLENYEKLSAEKKQLIEANSALENRVKELQEHIDSLEREAEQLRSSSKGTEVVQEKVDSLLSRINDVIGKE